ncbi:phospholipid scramblase 3-like [Pelobates fuscus]|uniref:phospholipid scramblase 3-like n=1 Tax=Pelobates fuscus TaxID=191477 RepID=UPI002FE46FF4
MKGNTGADDPLCSEPPSYNTIAPYAPPVLFPPVPSVPLVDSIQLKGVPLGLEYLSQINQLILRAKFSVSQGSDRTFDVLDSVGQRLFQTKQTVPCCVISYKAKITDNDNRDIMELNESYGCCTRLMTVCSLDGSIIGQIKFHSGSVVIHLSLLSPNNEVILLIVGPGFETNVFGNSSFEVKSKDEQHIVGIIKSEAENRMMVSFPLDLEVTVKSLLLAASLYLDYVIYEKRQEILYRKNSD